MSPEDARELVKRLVAEMRSHGILIAGDDYDGVTFYLEDHGSVAYYDSGVWHES